MARGGSAASGPALAEQSAQKEPEAAMSQGGQGPCAASGLLRWVRCGETPAMPRSLGPWLANARTCERPPFLKRKGNPRFKKIADVSGVLSDAERS